MDIKLECIGQTLVVKLSGEIDHHTSGDIRDILDREISSGNVTNLVFDFDRVTFMDSSGIGMMVGRYKQISALGGKVMVIRVSTQLDKIFEISGLKKILDFGKEKIQ